MNKKLGRGPESAASRACQAGGAVSRPLLRGGLVRPVYKEASKGAVYSLGCSENKKTYCQRHNPSLAGARNADFQDVLSRNPHKKVRWPEFGVTIPHIRDAGEEKLRLEPGSHWLQKVGIVLNNFIILRQGL